MRWQASFFFDRFGSEAVPVASQLVQAALRAAEEVLGPEAEPAPPPQGAAFEQFRALKHQPEQCGKVVFCSVCPAFCIMPVGSARGLLAGCKGRSSNPSTRDSQ
eukprot:5683698-Pyramimonas_sp.AAC.1